MKTNPELLKEFMNSEGHSRKMWKLLYTELLYNNPTLNSEIVREINNCLVNNTNLDLILDILDFCLDYGEKEMIDKILMCLEITDFYHLNSNKGYQTEEKTAQKYFYLINKWSENLGTNFPQFKEMYNKKSINKLPLEENNIKTYLNFLTKEDISDEKFIFDFYNNNKLKETIYKNINSNEFSIEQSQNIPGVDPKIYESKNPEQFKEKNYEIEKEKKLNENKKLNNEKVNTNNIDNIYSKNNNAGDNIKSNLANNPEKKIKQNLEFNEEFNIEQKLEIKKYIINIDNNGSIRPITNENLLIIYLIIKKIIMIYLIFQKFHQ